MVHRLWNNNLRIIYLTIHFVRKFQKLFQLTFQEIEIGEEHRDNCYKRPLSLAAAALSRSHITSPFVGLTRAAGKGSGSFPSKTLWKIEINSLKGNFVQIHFFFRRACSLGDACILYFHRLLLMRRVSLTSVIHSYVPRKIIQFNDEVKSFIFIIIIHIFYGCPNSYQSSPGIWNSIKSHWLKHFKYLFILMLYVIDEWLFGCHFVMPGITICFFTIWFQWWHK